MRLVALVLIAAGTAHAHAVSMSSGDISIDGAHARYELRMPIYEMAHVADPERAIFEHIKFKADGREGIVTERRCREDKDQDHSSQSCAFAARREDGRITRSGDF